MRGKAVTLAGFLVAELDRRRKVNPDTKQRESYTMILCRELKIKYILYGIKKGRLPGRNSGSPRKFEVRRLGNEQEG